MMIHEVTWNVLLSLLSLASSEESQKGYPTVKTSVVGSVVQEGPKGHLVVYNPWGWWLWSEVLLVLWPFAPVSVPLLLSLTLAASVGRHEPARAYVHCLWFCWLVVMSLVRRWSVKTQWSSATLRARELNFVPLWWTLLAVARACSGLLLWS